MPAPQTDKIKKNARKLNSGIPAKILIGRNGPNGVIQGNHYLQGSGTNVIDAQQQ